MFLGKVIKNLNKKYNHIKFRDISFNSKNVKKMTFFLPLEVMI